MMFERVLCIKPGSFEILDNMINTARSALKSMKDEFTPELLRDADNAINRFYNVAWDISAAFRDYGEPNIHMELASAEVWDMFQWFLSHRKDGGKGQYLRNEVDMMLNVLNIAEEEVSLAAKAA